MNSHIEALPGSVYRSKVDPLIAAITVGAGVATVAAAVPGLASASSPSELIGPGIGLAVVIGVGLVVAPTRYSLGDTELTVQSGLLHYHIPYDSIERVQPSRSLIASPAWSLDRIAIDYSIPGHGPATILISPVDKERFLDELAAAAGLTLVGQRWIPAPAGDD